MFLDLKVLFKTGDITIFFLKKMYPHNPRQSYVHPHNKQSPCCSYCFNLIVKWEELQVLESSFTGQTEDVRAEVEPRGAERSTPTELQGKNEVSKVAG